MINYIYKGLFSCLFSLFLCSGSAQFNIKVGYIGNYANLDKTNEIINLYNDDFLSIEKKLNPINFYNGIEIGTRYKLNDFIGIDIGLNASRGQNSAVGISSSTNQIFKNSLKIQLTNYYVGLENYFGTYGYGATIGYQKIKYSNRPSGSSDDFAILDQTVLSSKFYFILEVESNQNAFSLRPFVSINWDPYNIQELETALVPNSNSGISNYDENLMVFGLSLLIYNGPQ